MYSAGLTRGLLAGPVHVGNETVFFRGAQILNATLESLADAGLRRARNLIALCCNEQSIF